MDAQQTALTMETGKFHVKNKMPPGVKDCRKKSKQGIVNDGLRPKIESNLNSIL